MESLHERIEDANRTKISLMRSLVNCLDLEREHLVNLNVKSLWSLMEEKHRLLNSIVEAENEISNTCKEAGAESMAAHRRFSPDIQRLKQEIGARVRENVTFIQESLQFFDEIISVFASGGRAEVGYAPGLKKQKNPPSLIFEREV